LKKNRAFVNNIARVKRKVVQHLIHFKWDQEHPLVMLSNQLTFLLLSASGLLTQL